MKLVFLVNPSNPPSYRLSQDCLDYLVDVVKKDNPDLMIVTDDVYGTFAKDFKSLMYVLPRNTLCVYSLLKIFRLPQDGVLRLLPPPRKTYSTGSYLRNPRNALRILTKDTDPSRCTLRKSAL